MSVFAIWSDGTAKFAEPASGRKLARVGYRLLESFRGRHERLLFWLHCG